MCYDTDNYANVCYEYADGKSQIKTWFKRFILNFFCLKNNKDRPVITCVETGLRLDDLEIGINNLSNKLDCKNHDQSLAVQKLEDIENNLNCIQHKLNCPKDEQINIVIPPPEKPCESKSQKKKKYLTWIAMWIL